MHASRCVVGVLCLLALTVPATAGHLPPLALGGFVQIVELTSGLDSPIGVTGAGDGTNRLFIVEQGGRIRIWDGTQVLTTPFLDISALAQSPDNCPPSTSCGEQGLLGLAFHPEYENNGLFYVNYTCRGGTADCPGNGDTIVARYQVSAGDADVADPATRSVMIVVDQPFDNHNGGHLAFGPDGFLYIALGDGGSGGDTLEVAQDLSARAGNRGFLGKMLRIDVNLNLNQAPFYGIPATGNPFVGPDGIPDEIWAYGLRNPWRYGFDAFTFDLYIGDVGQNTREEVSCQPDTVNAQNYGWDVLEGTFCHEDVPSGSCTSFLGGGSRLPILEYGRSEGSTVIGGHVYRGFPVSTLLSGHYVFGDLGSQRIWRAIPPNLNQPCGGAGSWSKELLDQGYGVSSFGQDDRLRLFFVDLFSGRLQWIAPYTFADVPPLDFGWSEIEAIYRDKVTLGCGGDNFCPDDSTTRAQMAAFLLRAAEGPSFVPPPCSPADPRTFQDVPASNGFCPWIEELADRGITKGCGVSLYCPQGTVSREHMAIFLLRSVAGGDYMPPACNPPPEPRLFDDVPAESGTCPWVEELARRQITLGCAPNLFCPTQQVTRAQMAVFLLRTFGLDPI